MHTANGRTDMTIRPVGGHIGWIFSGRSEFEGRVASFLASGEGLRERMVLVAEDPNPRTWPDSLLASGALVLLSIDDVYGAERLVSTACQSAFFDGALAEALSLGYTGLRVAADNTSLARGPERRAAWLRWEDEVDPMLRGRPITGLCAFDRSIGDPASMHALAMTHRLVSLS